MARLLRSRKLKVTHGSVCALRVVVAQGPQVGKDGKRWWLCHIEGGDGLTSLGGVDGVRMPAYIPEEALEVLEDPEVEMYEIDGMSLEEFKRNRGIKGPETKVVGGVRRKA